jgi:hypothetical protein
VSPVAQFAVEAQIETVRCRYLDIDVTDEVAHPEFRRSGAYGQGVDRLPAGFEVLDAGENDLSSRELGELLL